MCIKKFNELGLVLDVCPRCYPSVNRQRIMVDESCVNCKRQKGINWEKLELACGSPVIPNLGSYDLERDVSDAPGADVVTPGEIGVS